MIPFISDIEIISVRHKNLISISMHNGSRLWLVVILFHDADHVSWAESWLGTENDKGSSETPRAGGSVIGSVSMYRCQGLPQGWHSKGSDSKASSTWGFTHGFSVYKQYPGIPLRERQVRCCVTVVKPIASLPASRRTASPTVGQFLLTSVLSFMLAEAKNLKRYLQL